MRELTIRALIMGSVLGLVFAASSVYLGLKVGLTVSASIPVAVLSITLFRWLRMSGTILENNIVQTTGSAGESLAAGVAFTLPSLLLMGFDLELIRILLVALFGGLIGVLMMIPLRHGLIVKEHGKLMYPEGTACADVLIVGEKGGSEAGKVFLGFFIGLGYAFLNLIAKLWADASVIAADLGGKLKKATIGFEVSPPMLGVGYIIGPKVSANMLAGGLTAFVVLIPLIAQFGGAAVADMSPGQLRNNYVLYIGAGAVATGGFIALARSIPTIIQAFRRGLSNIKTDEVAQAKVLRTERDLPMTIVLGGAAILAVAIFLAPVLDINLMTALLVILFGFFFVTVSSRITGEIGSSSNPISGMTIATLLLTCGLFVLLGWVGVGYKAMALTTAALVCVAASNGGTISQDLKTGFLVGATPKFQQIAILVGVVTSSILIGVVLLLLNDSNTTYEAVSYPSFSVKSVTDQTETGPDGKPYHVAYLRDDKLQTAEGTKIERGKYLVDEHGGLAFRVDPGVCGTYPFKLEKASGMLPVAGGAKSELGVDHKPYRVAEISGQHGNLGPGRYLVEPVTGASAVTLHVRSSAVKTAEGKTTVRDAQLLGAEAGFATFVNKARETMGGKDPSRVAVDTLSLALPADRTTTIAEVFAGVVELRFVVAGSQAKDEVDQAKGYLAGTATIGPETGNAAITFAPVFDWGRVAEADRVKLFAGDFQVAIEGPAAAGFAERDADLALTLSVGLLSDGPVAYFARQGQKFDAPKAQLFRLIIDGTLGGDLPWGLVLIGVFLAIILEMVGVSSLPFAVGLYLPIYTSGGIFVGGAMRWLVDRKRKGESASAAEFSPGMLMASGLIAGGAITGVLQSVIVYLEADRGFDLSGILPSFLRTNHTWWPLLPFFGMAFWLYWVGARSKR